MNLVEQIVIIHETLAEAELPHAFGGALALAWCTRRARATIDIDLNLFVHRDQADRVIEAMPEGVVTTVDELAAIVADGQARLWWGSTPIDVFFNTTAFHEDAARRSRIEPFGGADVPFLACRDLAVFKAFFNRTRDWADLEDMAAAETLDGEAVLGVLVHYLGTNDERVDRFRAMVQ